MAVKTPERGSFEAKPAGGCPGVCGGCPMACSSRPQTIRGESGSGQESSFKGSFKELLSLPKLPSVIDPNRIDFGSARSEKKCSECGETASTCPHSAARTH